jgi:hypothetical protein
MFIDAIEVNECTQEIRQKQIVVGKWRSQTPIRVQIKDFFLEIEWNFIS